MAYYIKVNTQAELTYLRDGLSNFLLQTKEVNALYQRVLQAEEDGDDVLYDFMIEAVRRARADGAIMVDDGNGGQKRKYAKDEWKSQTIQEQFEHIISHVADYQSGSNPEEAHLSHLVCRALFAYGLAEIEKLRLAAQETNRERTL